ncbi:MAG TPA: hypothetical protein VIC55_09345 [Gemmatimonadaceae bacterium]|jgi:hypothetical protein
MSERPEPDRYEELEERLDPHRREERQRVRTELIGQLQARGVHITGAESDEDVAELVEAAERFEREVEAHGGDLFVDSGNAREPDDPIFVLPKRHGHESVPSYLAALPKPQRR